MAVYEVETADGSVYEVETEDTPQPKPLLRRIGEGLAKSEALPIAGGVIGGVAGLPTAPFTMGLGPVATATAGGAAGESYRQLLSRAMGLPAPETSLEAAKQIGIEGGIQGASEVAGMGLGAAARPVLRPLGRGLAKVGEAVTRVPKERFMQLAADPLSLFAKSAKKAGEEYGEATIKAGVAKPETFGTLLKEATDTEGSLAKKAIKSFEEKLAQGTQTPADIFEAKQASSYLIEHTPGKERIRLGKLTRLKEGLDTMLQQASPEAKAAQAQYARSKTGEAFRTIFPEIGGDKYAASRLMYLPAFAAIAGGATGGRQGASGGAIGTGLAQSPAIAGGLTALGAGAGKLATSPLGSRAIVNPIVNYIVKGLLDRKAKRESDQSSSIGK
jgi:hypothetical protein